MPIQTYDNNLESDRDINFQKTCCKIGEHLQRVSYDNGDISDIGYEIGSAIRSIFHNMTEGETNMLILGIEDGIISKNVDQDNGLQIIERVLSDVERYKIWFSNNYETGMEYNDNLIPDFDDEYFVPTPTKIIKINHNGRMYERYE